MRLLISYLTVGVFVIDETIFILNFLFFGNRLFEDIEKGSLTIEIVQSLLVSCGCSLQGKRFLCHLDRFLNLRLAIDNDLSKSLFIRITDDIVSLSSVDVALVAAVIEVLRLLNIRYYLLMFFV